MAFDLSDFVPDEPVFRANEAVRPLLEAACAAHADVASFLELGRSEAGRPLYGVVLGTGPRVVSLLAGNHADEPVGPETLRTFVLEGLRHRDSLSELLARFRFLVVPHTNPDGEARNRPWIERWPSLRAFLHHVDREPPGRDLEFGFPAMRPENGHVSGFLRRFAPVHLHLSLHGMAFSEGALLLIERHWCGARTRGLRRRFAEAAGEAGLPLHDHNRRGEKGFFYVEPGFTTTPEGAAMQAHFRALGDEAMAARFGRSSMEWVRALGGDPLCLVTELPLFLLGRQAPPVPGTPVTYLRWKEGLPERQRLAQQDGTESALTEGFDVRPLSLRTAMRLHFQTLQIALEALPVPLPV